MRVINIVDRLDRVNSGIWNAAICTSAVLSERYDVCSEIWYPGYTRDSDEIDFNGARPRSLDRLDEAGLVQVARVADLDPGTDIIVSHGCWRYPTRWGAKMASNGFCWMAVPQGMLEPWSLSQKRLLKLVYFHALEKRSLLGADIVRAVSKPEEQRLGRFFKDRLVWIPNGVGDVRLDVVGKEHGRREFLFMSRLHHKKGVLPLMEAWAASPLSNRADCRLTIAGPDDGELNRLEAFQRNNPHVSNIRYCGPVYGEAKRELLCKSHFFVLPSHSEGFPTSLLEAMQQGAVPIISEGCNFPDVFELETGIKVEPEKESIRLGLEQAGELPESALQDLSRRARSLVSSNYTYQKIAAAQFEVFQQLLAKGKEGMQLPG